MEQSMQISGSPHLRSKDTVQRIMLDVVLALMPAAIAGVIIFGMNALLLMLISVCTAVATEAIIQKLCKKPVTVNDFSAVITGLLLSFHLPPSAPFWLPIVGSVFAVAIVKQVFGGLGHNFMNPAAAGRVFLATAYGLQMTQWINPVDGMAGATPLAILKGLSEGTLPSVQDMFLGNIGGTIGETCSLALIVGGLYLLLRGVINWRIPTFFLGTVALITWLFGGANGIGTGQVLYHMLGGGLLLGAFFMATDYVTAPTSKLGMIIMGVGCGLFTCMIRLLNQTAAEGVSLSILLMNVIMPLVDRVTKPRIYGEVKKSA